MNTRGRLNKACMLTLAMMLLILALPSPASASPPEPIYFNVVAGLGGFPGTWSSSGLVTSSGTATFDPFVAGWDSKLGMPATVHDTFVLTDEHGSIKFEAQGKSAIVIDDNDDPHLGFRLTWVIISGTGTYSNLHGQGEGYGWPDFATGTFPVYTGGQAHYDPQN